MKGLSDAEAKRIAQRLGQAAAQTLFEIVVPNPTLAQRARFVMSSPAPRRLCPGCEFVTIRTTDGLCRDCTARRDP